MEKMKTDIIKKGSVEELVARRDRAVELLKTAVELVHAANEAYKTVMGPETRYGLGTIKDRDFWYAVESKDLDRAIEMARTEIDGALWRHLLDSLGFRNYMDADSIKSFMEMTKKAPPSVTVENCRATFQGLRENASEVFRRGLVNVFMKLDTNYRTNSAFRLGKKVILTNVIDKYGYWNIWRQGHERISDVDRIFHVLDNKALPDPRKTEEGTPDHRGDAAAMLALDFRGEKTGVVETEYLRMKWFKNGSVHLEFKRADLVEKANRLIAEHFGEVLPDARQGRR